MLPRPVYVALPYLYIAAGIVTYLLLESPIAYLSVAALLISGGSVFLMRIQKKKKQKPFQNSAVIRVRDPARK